ncbi:hypothetical protein LTR09_006482 [Extremus antarcticus]|uniref:RING-type domain-containing protein n=1 Tax=Extremus antarcticus TaxID=702011 RepID=A0AAJ0DKN1_9PEZI|nr:hypothetical protein LTR09_006482 [Extremus antarcticus]
MAAPLDAYEGILALYNPDVNDFTCPGHTVSENRRCAVRLGLGKQRLVDDLLHQIRGARADVPGLAPPVIELTQIILCHHHRLHDYMRVGSDLLRAFVIERRTEEAVANADLQDVVLPRPVLPRPPVDPTPTARKEVPECGICLDPVDDAVKTPCGHYFCLACFEDFFNRWTKFCPMDRTELSWDELVMA